jgi:hypothetical protein
MKKAVDQPAEEIPAFIQDPANQLGRQGGFWGARIARPKSYATAPDFTSRRDILSRIASAKQFLSSAQQIEDMHHPLDTFGLTFWNSL